MDFRSGYLELFRWGRAPIRFHWSVPLGAFFFGHMRYVPGFWLGFVLTILIHELGHAAVVRAVGARVVSVDVLGIGGLCHWAGYTSPLGRACIAWGGVLAQAVLYAVTVLYMTVLGPPETWAMAELESAFTTSNLYIIVLNLLPVPPLDGSEAWRLPGLLWERWTKALERSKRARRARDELRRRERAAHDEVARLEATDEQGDRSDPRVEHWFRRDGKDSRSN